MKRTVCAARDRMLYLFVARRSRNRSSSGAVPSASFPERRRHIRTPQLWQAGGSRGVTIMNIDAITNWQFDGLRIDGLPRGLWYNPQHSFACALGLVAALVAAHGGARTSRGARWLAGLALGLSTCFNPFIGGVFSVIYGISVALDAVRTDDVRHWPTRKGGRASLVAGGAPAKWQVAGGAAGRFRGYAAHTRCPRALNRGVLSPRSRLWPGLRFLLTGRVAIVGRCFRPVMHLYHRRVWVAPKRTNLLLLLLLIARALWAER